MSFGATAGLLALMLAGALLGGSAAERLRMPRLVGWLVAGLALKAALWGLDRAGLGVGGMVAAAGGALDFIRNLSLAAVMFSVGLAFELHHLRRLGRELLWIAGAQSVGAAGLTFPATLAVAAAAGAAEPLLSAIFLAVIAVAISPAATLLTLRQYQAKGHTTDAVLAVTGLSAAIAIVAFDVAVAAVAQAGWVGPASGAGAAGPVGTGLAVTRLAAATGGSVLVGVALGVVLAVVHVGLAMHREAKVVLALLLAVLALSSRLGLDYLLTGLAAGVTFINLSPDPGRLEQRLAVVAGPLFALLFVVAGFTMHLGALAGGGMLALAAAYVLARTAGKVGGAVLAVRAARLHDLRAGLGAGLLCHAGVAVGLVGRLGGVLGEAAWVEQVAAVVLGSVALFEFAGPLLVKRTVVAAGEVKAFRLFHLPGPRPGTWARIRGAGASLARRLGVVPLPSPAKGPIRARHVMHANVKVLQAGAGLDEVLHFIERSRLDHFPVVDAGGRFMGTISLADVRDIIYQPELRTLVDAQDLLEDDLVVAGPEETLAELFEKFRLHKARDLVILDETSGAVLGVVEQRDVLQAMDVEQTRRKAGAGP